MNSSTLLPKSRTAASASNGLPAARQDVPRPGSGWGTVLIRNMVSNLAGQIATTLLVLISVRIFTQRLGTAGYGVFVLLMTYVETFSLLSLGLNAALIKFLAELLPFGRSDEARPYFVSSLFVFSAVGLAAATCISLFAPTVSHHFMIGAGQSSDYLVTCLWLGSGAFAVRFVRQVTSCVPMAIQRFDVYNLVTTGNEFLRITLSMLALLLGGSLRALMSITLVMAITACLADFIIIRWFAPELLRATSWSLTHVRSLFRYSKFVFAGNLSTRVVSSTDTFLISYLMPIGNITYYAVPYSIGQKLWILVGNLASVIFPAASAASSSPDRVRELYLHSSKVIAAIACFPTVALCILGNKFLLLWLGPDIAAHATLPLWLLSLAFLANCLGVIPYVVLQGTKYPAAAARMALVYAGVNVVLFTLLIPRFGVTGAASAFLLSQILTVPWMIHTANSFFHVGWKALLKHVYLPVVTAVLPAVIILGALERTCTSLWMLVPPVLAGSVLYGIVSWHLVLDENERRTCLAAASAWLPGANLAKMHRGSQQ